MNHQNEWLAVIDESGSTGNLIGLDGKVILDRLEPPTICAGAIILHPKAIESFNSQWRALRSQIQTDLGLTYLPAIHARDMYGSDRKIPPKVNGEPNPYLTCTREQRLVYMEKAMQIITDFSQKSRLIVTVSHAVKSELVEIDLRYFQSEFAKEYKFLLTKNGVATKLLFKKLFSPHIKVLSNLVIGLDQLFETRFKAHYCLVYDQSTESAGFDEARTFAHLKGIDRLRFLNGITCESSFHNQLIQAADLVTNLDFKIRNAARRNNFNDQTLLRWRQRFHSKWKFGKPETKHVEITQIAMSVAYAIGLHRVADRHADFLQYLVTPEELYERAKAASITNSSGISILKDSFQTP